jgi:hypothetical protein
MEAQLLVCDRISFDKEKKQHELGNVLNLISIPTFPYVINFTILAKLIYIKFDEDINCQLVIRDAHHNIVSYSNNFILRNHRSDDQVPGVDAHLDLSVILSIPGIIEVQLILNDEKRATYPLTVRLSETT